MYGYVKVQLQVEQLTGSETPMGMKELLLQWQREECIEQGLEQGIEIGKQQGLHEVARELKKEGLAIDFIAKTTKLSIDEIEAL